MRVLYISNKPPTPVIDGGTFAMHECLKNFAHVSQIDALIIESEKHPYSENSQKQVALLVNHVETVFIHSKNYLSAFVKSIFLKNSFLMHRFFSKQFAEKLTNLLKNNYDYIVCDSLFSSAAFALEKVDTSIPLLVRTHNMESEIWMQRADGSKNWVKKVLFKRFAARLKRDEMKIYTQAHAVLTLSDADSTWITNNVSKANVIYFPVSVTVSTESETDYSKIGFFHLGSMNWSPNLEAVHYLVNTLWSNNRLNNLPLKIAGSFSNQIKINTSSPSFSLVGWVDDATFFMQNSGTLVTPIFSGSGIRIKLLEAMALGVPCVTTKLGASGISITHSGLLIAETEDEFVSQLEKLTLSSELREQVGKKSKAYIQQFHSEERCISILNQLFEKA